MFAATDRTYNGIENVTEGGTIDLCATHLNILVLRLMGAGIGQVPNYEMGKKVVATVLEMTRGK
jgi:hypothetical protein